MTNKCYGDTDLEYYITEAGHILGLRLEEGQGARHVLSEVRLLACAIQLCSLPISQVCILVDMPIAGVPSWIQVFKRIAQWKCNSMGLMEEANTAIAGDGAEVLDSPQRLAGTPAADLEM